MIMRSKTTEK